MQYQLVCYWRFRTACRSLEEGTYKAISKGGATIENTEDFSYTKAEAQNIASYRFLKICLQCHGTHGPASVFCVSETSLQPETNSLVISYLVSALIYRVSRSSTVVSEHVISVAIKTNIGAVRLMEGCTDTLGFYKIAK